MGKGAKSHGLPEEFWDALRSAPHYRHGRHPSSQNVDFAGADYLTVCTPSPKNYFITQIFLISYKRVLLNKKIA
jgi:hypothetical protein